jgi:hypothetical protein
MSWRRALSIAACMGAFTMGQASAQIQPAPQQAQQQPPPCVQEFIKLRSDTEKKALAIRNASAHKASPKEACGLFNTYSAAEEKMLKYAADNTVWCGIPQQVVDQIKTSHVRTAELRTRICNAAAQAQMAPRGPSLSDALGSPVPDSNNIKTGRGTFDTLSGSALGSK